MFTCGLGKKCHKNQNLLRYSARYTNFWVNKIRQLSIKFEIHYMSKNNIRYSEYTHIWYYSGIQLLFFSNWSILFLHGNNCVRMSETQKCVSEQLPYKLTENFFLHSILSKPLQHQGPGTNKNLVVLLVQFSTQYVGTY